MIRKKSGNITKSFKLFAAGLFISQSISLTVVQPANAQFRGLSRGLVKTLRRIATNGTVEVGTTILESLRKPGSSPDSTQPQQSSREYVGSYYKCSDGCNYFWSSSGWWVFNGEKWERIKVPGGTVARTHNIYQSSNGQLVVERVSSADGFDPNRGWVRR